MEDKGKQKTEVMSSSSSNPSRMDTILSFVTSTDDDILKLILEDITTKEKEKKNYGDGEHRDNKILQFKKVGLDSLEGVKYYVQREMESLLKRKREMGQLDLNKPPPEEELWNEVGVPPPREDDNTNSAKVDGSNCRITVEEGFFIGKTRIPKRKRTMPKEEEEDNTVRSSCIRKTYNTSQCILQGSCSTSVIQRVDELRILHCRRQLKNGRQYYDQQNKQKKIAKVRRPGRPVVQQQRAWVLQPALAPPIPGRIEKAIREYGGSDRIMWVTEKLLTATDMRRNQNRLNFPTTCNAFLKSIMTDDEISELFKEFDQDSICNEKGRLHSILIDQDARVWDMDVRYWPKPKWVVFTGNWNNFVDSTSGLVPNLVKVQIWCFRAPVQGPLCFAINIVRSLA